METAAIVGWTGNGRLEDLEASVTSKLNISKGRVYLGSKTLAVKGEEPVAVARRLANMPGVVWVAAGYEFVGSEGWAEGLRLLAKRHLTRGSRFRLSAHVEASAKEEGDILLEGTGIVLRSAKGVRVDETDPERVFRITMVRDRGAVGVQLAGGPGGVPTSVQAQARCLVSGGYHSSVVAWMAALSGYCVTLVHAWVDDESLRQVARLYAELSKRMDAKRLSLEVLEGGGAPGDRLDSWLLSVRGEKMCGVHPECRGRAIRDLFAGHPQVVAPLLLLQEEDVMARLSSIGLKVKPLDGAASLRRPHGPSRYTTKRFGGRESDINGVLDSILS